MIYPVLLEQDINSFDYCFSEKNKCSANVNSKILAEHSFRIGRIKKNHSKRSGKCKRLQIAVESDRKNTKKRTKRRNGEKGKKNNQNIEGCSKCIILRNESHFKLFSEINANQVKGIV